MTEINIPDKARDKIEKAVRRRIASELEARAVELNCRDDYELLMARARELREEV